MAKLLRFTPLLLSAVLAVTTCVSRSRREQRVVEPLPDPVLTYFHDHYLPSVRTWRVLGPFPSPHDSLRRDLLLSAGGEAHAWPASGTVLVPPNQRVAWRSVPVRDRDMWSPQALLTRYTGYVPIHAGEPREGADTALAVAEIRSGGGLTRLLLNVWGRARLCINGAVAVDHVDFENFFGQYQLFTRLKAGANRVLVKAENESYNSVDPARRLFGSWGFYVQTGPAAELTGGVHVDVPFLADAVEGDTRVAGILALRARGKARPATVKLTLRCSTSTTEVIVPTPPSGGVRLHAFLIPLKDGVPQSAAVLVEHAGTTVLRVPVTVLPRYDRILLRAIVSPSDHTIQPYLLYHPSESQKAPVLLHLHGAVTTEEELVNEADGLIEVARAQGLTVCAPRAREGSLLSGQAEADILCTLNEVFGDVRASHARCVVVGSGTGGVCALRLVSHVPDLFTGAVVVPTNRFERAARITPDFSKLHPMLANLRGCPVLVVTQDNDPAGQFLKANLKAAGADTRFLAPRSPLAPFSGDDVASAIRSVCAGADRRAPAAISFTTTHLRWNRSWWISVERFLSRGAPATVTARVKEGPLATCEITTDNAGELLLVPHRFPPAVSGELSILWNGEEIFSGTVDRRTSIRLSHTDTAAMGKRARCEGPLDELLREPHSCVAPQDTAWKMSAARLVKRPEVRARYGRNTAAWRSELDVLEDHRSPRRGHLVLFGGPAVNPLVAKLAPKLPVTITSEAFAVADRTFPLATHMVLLVCPCPECDDRLLAVVAGHDHERFCTHCDDSRLNPFAYPEDLPDIVVYAIDERSGRYTTVFRANVEGGGRRIVPAAATPTSPSSSRPSPREMPR